MATVGQRYRAEIQRARAYHDEATAKRFEGFLKDPDQDLGREIGPLPEELQQYAGGSAQAAKATAAQAQAANRSSTAMGKLSGITSALGKATGAAWDKLGEFNTRMRRMSMAARGSQFPLNYMHLGLGALGITSVVAAGQVGALDQSFYQLQIATRHLQVAVGQLLHAGLKPFYPMIGGLTSLFQDSDRGLSSFGSTFGKVLVSVVGATLAYLILAFSLKLVTRAVTGTIARFGAWSAVMAKTTIKARILTAALRGLWAAAPWLLFAGLATGIGLKAFSGGGEDTGGTAAVGVPSYNQPVMVTNIYNQGSMITDTAVTEYMQDALDRSAVRPFGGR